MALSRWLRIRVLSRSRPAGALRLAFRLPIFLYRLHLGWLLGHRGLLLTHHGRKSGRVYHTVLEVVRYDPVTRECVVLSGWGEKADWYRNIKASPALEVRTGRERYVPEQRFLAPEENHAVLSGYARCHPLAFRFFAGVFGYPLDGTDAARREFAASLRMVAFRPKERRQVMISETLERHFQTIEEQRRAVLPELYRLEPHELWRRPSASEWSIGQWLEHLAKSMKLSRRVLQVYKPVALPFALLFRNRPFEREIENTFETDPDSVSNPFFGILPKDRTSEPITLSGLIGELELETNKLKELLTDLDEDVAGHIKIWDGPSSGFINLHQAIQNMGFHERNDFRHILRMLGDFEDEQR